MQKRDSLNGSVIQGKLEVRVFFSTGLWRTSYSILGIEGLADSPLRSIRRFDDYLSTLVRVPISLLKQGYKTDLPKANRKCIK